MHQRARDPSLTGTSQLEQFVNAARDVATFTYGCHITLFGLTYNCVIRLPYDDEPTVS